MFMPKVYNNFINTHDVEVSFIWQAIIMKVSYGPLIPHTFQHDHHMLVTSPNKNEIIHLV